MDIFWNYAIPFFHCGCWGYESCFETKSWKAILIILNPTNKTNIIMSYDHFMIILPCQMASLKKVELEAMTMLTILKTISP